MASKAKLRPRKRGETGKDRAAGRIRATAYGGNVPDSLYEAIERERATLNKAESILRCLTLSLESESSLTKGPYYPDITEMARELVRRAWNGLDSLHLAKCVQPAAKVRIGDRGGYADEHFYQVEGAPAIDGPPIVATSN